MILIIILNLYILVVLLLLYLNYRFWKHIKKIEGKGYGDK